MTAAAAAAVAVVVRARARAALSAGRAAAAAVAAWTSERARVALSTGATADPRAWCVIAKRGGCPALRVPNDVCLETGRQKNGDDFPPAGRRYPRCFAGYGYNKSGSSALDVLL